VRTGSANLASVVAALERAGRMPRLVDDAVAVARVERLVLPGVGAFGAVMARLVGLGLVEALTERIAAGRPTLAICLGLQVLASGSDESAGVAGFGVIPGRVTRFPDGVVVPQLGWNRVEADPGCRLLCDGAAYFANSYKLDSAPEGWSVAWSDHGGRFVGALERGAVLACQFHPELSGAWGAALLERWLEASLC
jgi:imidazole glycerol-phosphate synthase subunit HisH